MPKNLALKVAIVESGQTQVAVSEAVGMDNTRLSTIIHGRRAATEAEQKALAKVLKRKRADLFPTAAAPVPGSDSEAVA